MKSGFKLLFLFTILFCSCYENEVIVSDEAFVQEEEEVLTLKQVAGENTIVMSNLLADIMKVISLSNEVNFDSNEPIAQVRNSCPSTFLISDGVYPDTFFINFDNCDPSAVYSQRFDGGLMIVLNGALDDPNVCPLFSVKNSPALPDFFLKVDDSNKGYTVDIQNEVDFCLQNDINGNLKYNYVLDGGLNLNSGTAGGTLSGNGFAPFLNITGTTCYPSGMRGCITMKPNNKDDLTKPSTLLDNTYCVSAEPTVIECKTPRGDIERLCIATNPEGIVYNLRCGCPQNGKLYIDSPANGDCDDIQNTDSFWYYGYIQNPGNSSCENSAIDPDNLVQRIPCGQSF